MIISNTEYFGVSLESIPPLGSKHRQMLDLYMSGKINLAVILEDFSKRYEVINLVIGALSIYRTKMELLRLGRLI